MIIVSIYCQLVRQSIQLSRHRVYQSLRVQRIQRSPNDYCLRKYQLLVVYISWLSEAAPVIMAVIQFNQSAYSGSYSMIAVVGSCLSSINKTNLQDHFLDSETPCCFHFLLLLSNRQLFGLRRRDFIRFFTFLCSFLR